jgi:hypothetical protein
LKYKSPDASENNMGGNQIDPDRNVGFNSVMARVAKNGFANPETVVGQITSSTNDVSTTSKTNNDGSNVGVNVGDEVSGLSWVALKYPFTNGVSQSVAFPNIVTLNQYCVEFTNLRDAVAHATSKGTVATHCEPERTNATTSHAFPTSIVAGASKQHPVRGARVNSDASPLNPNVGTNAGSGTPDVRVTVPFNPPKNSFM